MRTVAKILSIMTIVLTLLPCSDGYAQYQNNNTIQISLNTDNTQDHHSDDSDLCTPFCTCVCCASLVYVVKSLDVSQPELINIDLNQYYTSNLISDFISSNFQPPKV
jgi:Family of unknown function (DUF6660)